MTKSKISVPEAIGILLSIFIAHTIVSLPRNLLLNTKTSTIINLIYIGILSIFIVLFIVKLLRKRLRFMKEDYSWDLYFMQ